MAAFPLHGHHLLPRGGIIQCVGTLHYIRADDITLEVALRQNETGPAQVQIAITGGPFFMTGGPSGPPVNMLKNALILCDDVTFSITFYEVSKHRTSKQMAPLNFSGKTGLLSVSAPQNTPFRGYPPNRLTLAPLGGGVNITPPLGFSR